MQNSPHFWCAALFFFVFHFLCIKFYLIQETCLFSEAIESKTNEIPHAQQLLAKMTLKDTVVTFDAMHLQTKTIGIIADSKRDYVGG